VAEMSSSFSQVLMSCLRKNNFLMPQLLPICLLHSSKNDMATFSPLLKFSLTARSAVITYRHRFNASRFGYRYNQPSCLAFTVCLGCPRRRKMVGVLPWAAVCSMD
jgi:hypothetical protein